MLQKRIFYVTLLHFFYAVSLQPNKRSNKPYITATTNIREIVQQDNIASSHDAKVTCHFKNWKNALLKCIEQADYVIGCVAWFTDNEILAKLKEKNGVCVLVQKEDFLRPDCQSTQSTAAFGQSLRKKYVQIKGTLCLQHQ